jgi:hypothetical protein
MHTNAGVLQYHALDIVQRGASIDVIVEDTLESLFRNGWIQANPMRLTVLGFEAWRKARRKFDFTVKDGGKQTRNRARKGLK